MTEANRTSISDSDPLPPCVRASERVRFRPFNLRRTFWGAEEMHVGPPQPVRSARVRNSSTSCERTAGRRRRRANWRPCGSRLVWGTPLFLGLVGIGWIQTTPSPGELLFRLAKRRRKKEGMPHITRHKTALPARVSSSFALCWHHTTQLTSGVDFSAVQFR